MVVKGCVPCPSLLSPDCKNVQCRVKYGATGKKMEAATLYQGIPDYIGVIYE